MVSSSSFRYGEAFCHQQDCMGLLECIDQLVFPNGQESRQDDLEEDFITALKIINDATERAFHNTQKVLHGEETTTQTNRMKRRERLARPFTLVRTPTPKPTQYSDPEREILSKGKISNIFSKKKKNNAKSAFPTLKKRTANKEITSLFTIDEDNILRNEPNGRTFFRKKNKFTPEPVIFE